MSNPTVITRGERLLGLTSGESAEFAGADRSGATYWAVRGPEGSGYSRSIRVRPGGRFGFGRTVVRVAETDEGSAVVAADDDYEAVEVVPAPGACGPEPDEPAIAHLT